jgi:protein-ribulosamine 3-kinase
MWSAIADAIASATGMPFKLEHRAEIGGGCINSAYRIEGGGTIYFVKANGPDKADMFAAEAAALEEIAKTGTVRAPRLICHGANQDASWLVLEYITLVRRGDFSALGQQLAAMHRVIGRSFGWWRDNTIGATPQVNTPLADWVAFWREHRLGFQLRLAATNGYRGGLQREGEKLLAKLPELLANHRPPPSLLHGDLWSGNVAFDQAGQPVIFDPATYYGDREADLAMTELFGRLSEDFYAAYSEVFPLDAGYALRKDLYNLYHVLNHLNLFGGGYLAQAERMIDKLFTAV